MKDLEQNTGQIPGLPANPRQWTKKEIDKIAKSLQETPELFEARPIIVIPWEGKYIILGGNLRYEGCKRNKDKDAPCFIIPTGTPVDKMKEIIIKDNGSFGEWDYDALGNLWDDLPLLDWGVPAWESNVSPDGYGTDFNLPDGEGPQSNQITFYFSPEQKNYVLEMLERVQNVPEEVLGNKNINGNRLYTIVEQWEKSRT